MNLYDAERLARSLMDTHGLQDVKLAWDFKARTFGSYVEQVSMPEKTVLSRWIRLSKRLTKANTEAVVRDVILHEIAHALVGHDAGHGPLWRGACLRVGAVPEACKAFDFVNVVPPSGGWIGVCPVCQGKRWRARRPTRSASCGQCHPVGYSAAHAIAWTRG